MNCGKCAEDSLSTFLGSDPLDTGYLGTSSRILAILKRYQLKSKLPSPECKEADLRFLAQINARVITDEPILMCLPSFPFKSPNTTSKVLGRLPDKAEEFALAHLDGLCAAIRDIYPPGARLTIVSDGLVYNDLLGVPDCDVWAYGEALRALSARQNYSHIEFCRLKDLVRIDVPDELDEMTYVANATNFRHGLLTKFSKPGFDASLRISEDEDTCLTYRGYIKFLETDLRYVYPVGPGRSKSKYKKGIEYIAKQMLNRGDAFAQAVRERFPDRIRLSIHPSCGMKKLSISLLPTDSLFTTPWHCSIAFRLDGTVATGHRSGFDTNAEFELVYEDGQPSFYREKSDLVSWAKEKGGITCTPVYPAGWLIQSAKGAGALSILDIDAGKVRAMSELSSPIILRGFSRTRNRELFVRKAGDFGIEVEEPGANTQGRKDTLAGEALLYYCNNLIGSGAEQRAQADKGGEQVSQPPRFQFMTAVTASPKDSKFTTFSNSSLIFKYLPAPLSVDYLRKLSWIISAPPTDGTGMVTGLQDVPLVVDHPSTKAPCLRYHHVWHQDEAKLGTTKVASEKTQNMPESLAIRRILDDLLQDRRVVYHHAWAKGDLVVNDNILAMNTRNGFTAGGDRRRGYTATGVTDEAVLLATW
ncbi:putative pyoverdine/dityrosine biosynthesis protein [Biscogniauxia sp. FL1348]|nr:putative pyoverdine/dityrosine biosynthesis protein [Biscogniauxia sp. FL1348]